MNEKDIQARESIVPRDALVKYGISAVACFAGGAFFLLMMTVGRHGFFGIILSAIALLVGLLSLFSKDADAKKPGLLITAAGVLGMILRFVRIPSLQAISATVLVIGALGFLAAGLWKGVQFLQGLKTRR